MTSVLSSLFALPALCALAALTCASAVHAQAPSEEDEVKQPLWEVGAVALGVSQQAYPGSDQRIRRGLALPYFIYRGKVLRADRDTAGLRAIKTETFELDVGFAASFGTRSDEIEARRGMPELGTLVEFGPRLRWNLGAGPGGGNWRAVLPLRGVFDLSDSGAHRGMALEPELQFQRRSDSGWNYTASIGAIIADQRLASTFYEVRPEFARTGRPAYEADAGLVAWRLGASLGRKLTPDWRVFGFARVDTVSGAANQDSPLVRRNTGMTAGVGVAYTWLRSEAMSQD
nr:MipA/OmpV family protein [uncultured Aquabacterium sp.]